MTTPKNNPIRRSYGSFVTAAAIYTAGVIAFSIWSFFQQRANLLEQVDQSLLNATHATEQILGNIFITCAVETGTNYTLGFEANQDNLNRFSSDCHFDIVGAIGYKDAQTWELIAGGEHHKTLPAHACHGLLNANLASDIQHLANAEDVTTLFQTIETEKCGKLRVALRYHPISNGTGYALLVSRNTLHTNQLIHSLALRTLATGLFLHLMAFPLIVLYSRSQTQATRKLAALNAQLKQDVIKQKEREAELEDAIRDLERFNTVAVGRETRIIELKAEVNTLLEQMKRQKRYTIDSIK